MSGRPAWNSRVVARERRLPSYDASSDPLCPLSRTPAFKRRSARSKALEAEEERKRRLRSQLTASAPLLPRTADWEMEEERLPRRHATGRPGWQPDGGRRGGGVTFSSPTAVAGDDGAASEAELEALKAILLREGYLERLEGMAGSSGRGRVTEDVIDCVDLLRLSTVEVVEAIGAWRTAAGTVDGQPRPFVWNGVNYLLKLPSDMHRLKRWASLADWLGFSLERNPFLVPAPLEAGRRGAAGRAGGGRVTIGSSTPPSDSHRRRRRLQPREKMSASTGGLGSPYGERDEAAAASIGLSPSHLLKRGHAGGSRRLAASSSSSPAAAGGGAAGGSFRQRSMAGAPASRSGVARAAAGLSGFTPSHIGDTDMLRVRAAEKLLLDEETARGRMVRSRLGRLLPEELTSLDEDEADALAEHRTARVLAFTETAPAASDARRRRHRKPRAAAAVSRPRMPHDSPASPLAARTASAPSSSSSAAGAASAAAAAGAAPLPSFLLRPAPTKTKLSRLEVEIRNRTVETRHLDAQLIRLRAELLEAEQAAAAVTSAEAEPDAAAAAIQAAFRGMVGRRSHKRRQRELEVRRDELAARAAALEAKQAGLAALKQEQLRLKRVRAEEKLRRREAARAAAKREEERLAEEAALTRFEEEQKAAAAAKNLSALEIAKQNRARQQRARQRRRRRKAATRLLGGHIWRYAVRRRERIFRQQAAAATRIQAIVRGRQGRARGQAMMRTTRHAAAARLVQRVYRGHRGRWRAKQRVLLKATADEAKLAASAVFPSALAELASIDDIAPPLARAVEAVVIMTLRDRLAAPPTHLLTWRTLRYRLRQPQMLAKMHSMAKAAAIDRLLLPHSRVEAVRPYFLDPSMTEEGLAAANVAASLLWRWLALMVRIHDLCTLFHPERAWLPEQTPDVYDELDDGVLVAGSAPFLPRSLLRAVAHDMQPMIVGIAADVPSGARASLVRAVLSEMQGAFAHLSQADASLGVCQSLFSRGQHVLLDVDVGISASTRARFMKRM
eukprot:PLAT3355.21.p1 GENE.PLAT3355.21~~PLAT3355.21.p1  ORF type:complete len:1015 (-),score=507.57 PLAT3355.21:44-3088(-)